MGCSHLTVAAGTFRARGDRRLVASWSVRCFVVFMAYQMCSLHVWMQALLLVGFVAATLRCDQLLAGKSLARW